MKTGEYLENILQSYKSTFDIIRPYQALDIFYSAYGYFYSHSEKYVMTKEVQLWETNSYEHIFFLERRHLLEEDLDAMDQLIHTYAEPVLVRKGESLPDKNHMYSYISFVFLSDETIDPLLIRRLKKYCYSKTYLFSLRGWCDVRIIAIDLAENNVYSNKKGARLKRVYKSLLK